MKEEEPETDREKNWQRSYAEDVNPLHERDDGRKRGKCLVSSCVGHCRLISNFKIPKTARNNLSYLQAVPTYRTQKQRRMGEP